MKTSGAKSDLQNIVSLSIISPHEIADLFGKSVSWVYRHTAELGAIKIGNSYVFTVEGLQHGIEKGKELASEGPGKQKDLHQGRIRNEARSPKMGTKYQGTDSIQDRAKRLGLVVSNC